MARALEAGGQGESTAATQALAATDFGRDPTSATRAMRTRAAPAPARTRDRTGTRAPARREARSPARRRRMGGFLAMLAVIAAIAAVGIALLAANGKGVQAPNSSDAKDQVQQLHNFLRDHSR
jgi:hypothetical protein